MKLFFMEVRKLCGKKIMWIGMIAMMAFFIFYFWGTAIEEVRIYEHGEWVEGIEAIKRNKEIARNYEGILTLEKAYDIIEKYGFSYYDMETYWETGNDSSRFITHIMTELRQTEEQPEEFVKNSDGSYLGTDYLEGDVTFGYTEGWENLRESMMIYIGTLSILLIIIVSPVFTEEYTLRTAEVALTTKHGRQRDIWMKIGAALFVSALLYIVAVGGMYAAFLYTYGADGLNASAYMLVRLSNLKSVAIWQFFLVYFLLGIAAVLLNTCITLAISATFRQGMITVITSLSVYLLPFVMSNIVFSLLPVTRVTLIIKNIFTWFPFYLAHCQQFGIMPGLYIWRLLFVLGLFIASIMTAYRIYRN